HAVEPGVALGDLDHVAVDVHAHHLAGAAHRGIHREAAGVAAQVEHALAGHLAAQPLAVLALVGEEAGLVGAGRVGAETDAVFGDDRGLGAGRAVEVEALLLLHVLVGEGVEAAARELRPQRVHDPLAVAEHAGREVLQHQQVGVAVHHQAAQPVALAVHHAPGVAHLVQAQHVAAQRHRRRDLPREPAGVDRHVGMRLQDPHRDARVAVVEAAADPFAVHAHHVDDGPGLGARVGPVDQLLEDPRMAGPPGVAQADHGQGVVHAWILPARPCAGGIRRHAGGMHLPHAEPPADPAAQRAADGRRFRRAAGLAVLAVLVLAVAYAVQPAFDVRLFAVSPGRVEGLVGLGTAPPLHGSLEHIVANGVAVLMLGTLAGWVYPRAALRGLPLMWLGSGLGAWLLGDPGSWHLGASGVTHGLMFLVLGLALLRRDRAAIA